METSEAQRNITRNVRILMAARDMYEQRQLAEALGWTSAKMTKTLQGNRKWSVEDLIEVADVFGISPGALLGSTTEVVMAVGPAQTAARAVNGPSTGAYVAAKSRSIGEFAHVIDLVERKKARTQRLQGVASTDAPNQVILGHVG